MPIDLDRPTPRPRDAILRKRPKGSQISADPRPGHPRNAARTERSGFRTGEVRFTDWALI